MLARKGGAHRLNQLTPPPPSRPITAPSEAANLLPLLPPPRVLLIGILFPSGLRRVGNILLRSVPAMWGLNAISAIFGSVLASAIAMTLGFEAVLLGVAILYGLAALLLVTVNPKEASA